ncbi:helix-turn-helix domain-containing protein [Oceanobacillus sp. 1P07AA]|uniref:helix-turn-helix domain-containing protein n=1 Tax=Oceanobacillus sp. 1P07AA TaxID=3132293 RepID=UPI0039A49615
MFSNRLKSLRKSKDKTQKYMADYLGISRQGYAKYEDGNSEPDHKTLLKLSEYFDVTTDYLLGNSDQPHLTEDEAFDAFINDPDLERWYKELPKSKEEDLRRLRKIWEAFKEDD